MPRSNIRKSPSENYPQIRPIGDPERAYVTSLLHGVLALAWTGRLGYPIKIEPKRPDILTAPEVNMPKIAVVGIRGGWSSEGLADALAAKTGHRILIDMDEISFDLDRGEVRCGDLDLMSLDGLIIKKICPTYSPHVLDRLEILRYLNERGLPIFSRPGNVLRCVNRLSCTVTLRLGKIPMPPTIITEDDQVALEAVQRYGRCVFKPLYTSKARGMVVITAGPGALDEIHEFKAGGNPVMYIQKMINFSGRDMGMAFLGGEYVGAFAREAQGGSWNTTTHSGGRYRKIEPAPEVVNLARCAQALFGLDFTIVDVAVTEDGPVIFEVSAFGGFRGLSETWGVQAAALYADYVVNKLTPKA